MSRIHANIPFSLTDFGRAPGTKARHRECLAGEYILIEGVHPDPGFRGTAEKPNRMFFIEGHPTIGACLGWWQHEVDEGRMKWL